MAQVNEPFYVRYYSGHTGRFGHGTLTRAMQVAAYSHRQSFLNLTSAWWATAEAQALDTQTIPIIEMTPLYGKRVCALLLYEMCT